MTGLFDSALVKHSIEEIFFMKTYFLPEKFCGQFTTHSCIKSSETFHHLAFGVIQNNQ